MLSEIYIKGLAVIDELSINFSPRLNVITGETGAGKSILIKALGLVLGGKGSADVVRKGEEFAVVSASFELEARHQAFVELEANGLSIESEDGLLILRRQVNKRGRSQAWVNDVPITLGVLKQVGIHLIDVFGQHDNHKLLDANYHSYFLDQFLSTPSQVDQYKKIYRSIWQELKGLIASMEDFQNKLRDKDYLEFRKQELDGLLPSMEDYESQKSFLESSKELIERHQSLRLAETILDQGYTGQPLSQAMSEVIRNLSQVDENSHLLAKAHDLEELLNQFSFEVGRKLSDSDVNESEIQEAKARLAKYNEMMHKMNVRSVEGLISTYSDISGELDFLENGREKLERKVLGLRADVDKLFSLGKKLSASRKRAFQKIQKRIRTELGHLNMKGADLFLQMSPVDQKLQISITDFFDGELQEAWTRILEVMSASSLDGFERTQFLLRANPGDEPKPLSKIASGGEISRIMLGIKKVLSEGAHTCVMVFDEIDTGISGQTASIVGRKLSEISQKFQVICISHLPQVAVFGNSHFKVHKSIIKGRAESKITRMNEKQCVEEVARLLSSGAVTSSSLQNARELYKESRL